MAGILPALILHLYLLLPLAPLFFFYTSTVLNPSEAGASYQSCRALSINLPGQNGLGKGYIKNTLGKFI
jgi:hypothetical protein